MIGASKILTVSYGTFSCTLEGFDEPFNTMKAIAEYFRDLAADDRYFGAEPPTPDAAMLHKIAEREIHRRVEAKIQENGVVLRAGDLISEDAGRDLAQPEPLQAVVSAPTVVTPPLAETPPSESVAAKLARIRSAVAQAAVPTYTEDQHAEVLPVAHPVAEPTAVFASEPVIADAAEEISVADAPIEIAEDISSEDEAMALNALLAQDAQPEDDAPLSAFEVMDEPIETLVDSQESDDALLDSLAGLAETQHDFADAIPAQVLRDDLDADDLEEDILGDLVALDGVTLGDLDLQDHSDDLPEDEATDEAVEASLDEQDDDFSGLLASLAAEVMPVDAPIEHAVAYDVNDDDSFDAEDLPAAPMAETILQETVFAEIEEVSDAVEVERPRMRARVIKVRRLQIGDTDQIALSTETRHLSEIRHERPRPLVQNQPDALSAEAEADLMRQLGESVDDTPKAPVRPVRPARLIRPVTPRAEPVQDAPLPVESKDNDADLRRLMAQTDTEMGVPENRRRLSAIAHLKAAVAATVADRRIGGTPRATEEQRADPYRNDLSQMVRPSTNTPVPQAESVAVAPKIAPLVLVSAQRVDPLAFDAQPLQPHRPVTAQDYDDEDDLVLDDDENIFTDTKGFAEFADRLGANSLQDMLEAAAAFTSCIEGRPHFSRPQLMRQVSELTGDDDYVREDGLRGFGNLLRAGTIAKVKRGQYALSEDSHFLTEARKLVG